MPSAGPSDRPGDGAWVVVGESLVDIVVDQDGGRTSSVGGSPMNVAIGLARLDVPTLLITQVGDDEYGQRVAGHVRSSGAVLFRSSMESGRSTSTATALLDSGNSASYEFDLTWDLPEHDLPESVGLHVGSLGASLPPGRESVLDLVRQAATREVFTSYDPNIRPAFVRDRRQAWLDTVELAGMSTLVKVSDEDLDVLRPGESVPDLAHELLTGERTELVILTRGDAGAVALTSRFHLEVAAPTVDVVDTVGAGDSFMAATLAILVDWRIPGGATGTLRTIDEERAQVLLGGAMAAAAVTCSRRGANPPTRKELPTAWPAEG